MCGIVGLCFSDRDRTVEESLLRRMCLAIAHRGPDDEGVLVDGSFGMGMRRLSVIDVQGGHQPMFSEDGHVAVVYNGEIYNYPELRSELVSRGHRFRTQSDTEVLVHGYEEWGEDLPGHLNGMFAFSIWDAPNRRLFIARDRIGIKPLYVIETDAMLAWASEIKALLQIPGVHASVNHAALREYMGLGYVPAPDTLFQGIRKLPPATCLVLEGGKVRTFTYWDLAFSNGQKSVQDWCEELRWLVDDSVRRQLVSDVPLGAFLSGGIDSSAIVATMARLGVDHLATYAIGFGAEDAYHNELAKAGRVAAGLGTDHHEILVEPDVASLIFPLIYHLDEPLTDTSFVVTYLVSKLARETVTVILSGVGGDEIFTGYRRYLWPHFLRWYGRLPAVMDRTILRPLVRRLPVDRGSRHKALFRYARGFIDQLDKPDARRYQGYVGIFGQEQCEAVFQDDYADHLWNEGAGRVAAYYDAAASPEALNRMLYADLKTSLVDSLLAFTDKMSMAVSLEARVPLLDHRLVEFMAGVPPQLKLRGVRGAKYLFKMAMSDRLPRQILHQRKQGFGTPISRWFRGSLKPLLHDLLAPELLKRRGYFKPEAVWSLIDAHMEQRADYSEHILALLTFEVWHQVCIDAGSADAFRLPIPKSATSYRA